MAINNQEQALIELYNIVKRLVSLDENTDLNSVLKEIVESAHKALQADVVTLYEYDEKSDKFTNFNLAGELLKADAIFAPDISEHSQGQNRFVVRENIKSSAGVPLKVGDKVVGVMFVNFRTPQSFTDSQRMLITLFANQAALAIQNLQKIQRNRVEGKTSEHYSCFISYSSNDEVFVRKLYNDLQSNNVTCWFAPVDLKIGDRIRSRIDDIIKEYDKLLLILSESSIKSQWVEQEVETALELERREQKTKLFPIRIDKEAFNVKSGWAKFVHNTRNIGDFENWQDDSGYEQAYQKLLRDIVKA